MDDPTSQNMNPGPSVSPDQTVTTMTQICMPGHCNSLGTAFGGQVMAWIDVCAAVSAQRFSRGSVVTASMDQLDFRVPVRLGDMLVFMSSVNWSGQTSMEVGVRAEVENIHTSVRHHVATAYLTFVHVDDDGRPVPVPELLPRNDTDRRRQEAANIRRDARLSTRQALAKAGL